MVLIFLTLTSPAILQAQSTYATPYTFTTLAGSAGTAGSNDGIGGAARFSSPYGITVDSSGNVYLADNGNHTIRKITSAGVVTTFAGTAGNSGSTDGAGSSARFNFPFGVALDGSGNIYVADYFNYVIRKITAAGVTTTLAGSAGNSGSTDGTGSAARFNVITDVAVDGEGNVYVADYGNHTIRKVSPTGVVTTIAGSAGSSGSADGAGSVARFKNPNGVAVDSEGNVLVADYSNQTIRKITNTGLVTTLAGTAGSAGTTDGTGGAARFSFPSGVAADGSGNVYVVDYLGQTIRKITYTGVVTTIAGIAGTVGATDGIGSAALFDHPVRVTVDGTGSIYVSDNLNNTIRKGTRPASALWITTQPTSQAVRAGSTFTLTAAVSGTPSPTYQWQSNGLNISGANSPTLIVANADVSDAGFYSVIATNFAGSVRSNPAALVVIPVQSDFDGDGRSEPLWRNSNTGEVRAWLVGGNSISFGNEGGGWSVIKVGDFDADVWSEPLWRNSVTGEIRTWLSAGGSIGFGTEGGGWSVINVGDFNGDGRAEPLWRNSITGEIRTWITNVYSIGLGTESGGWSVINVGDFDKDGRSEPLWRNSITGEVRTWLSTGGSIGFGTESGGWSVINVGDFDNDRRSEPLWRNSITGEIRSWVLAGGSIGFGTEGGNWSVINIGDFDGDGRSEPLWRNSITGEVRSWLLVGGSVGFGTEGGGWSIIN